MVQDIHSEAELDAQIGDAKGFILLEFLASWCRPCKVMMPTVSKIAEEIETMSIYRIDIEEMEDFSERFYIQGTPTFILFCDGKEQGRIIGYHDGTTFREKLTALMEK